MDGVQKTWATLVVIVLVALVGLGFMFSTFEQINAGERGVVLHWGAYESTLGEGFHVVNPISNDIIVMNVRVQKYEVAADAASKDLQTVTSTIALNFHVDPQRVGTLYQEVGTDYEVKVVQPAIQESVKVGTALFTAEELISKRASVKEAIKQDLVARLDKFYIIVDDFSIMDFGFSTEFDKAIELKQVAEQDALRAQNELDKIKLEAAQQIATAQAEAESTRLQAEALKNSSQVIELRRTEALLEFAKQWNGDVPTSITILGNDGGVLPLLNLN